MALTAYPFDNVDTTESQYSQLFRELQDSGVAGSSTSIDFKVTGDGSGMNVKVQPGFAIVRGHAVQSTAIETRPITNAASLTRIDNVVLRLDPSLNSITLVVVDGIPGGAAPALTQTDTGVYEVLIGQVTVDPGVLNISSAVVADVRRYVGSHVGNWTTETRPSSPRFSRFGLNRSTSAWEYWDGFNWQPLITWATISGKPATFPPDVHTHNISGASVAHATTASSASSATTAFGLPSDVIGSTGQASGGIHVFLRGDNGSTGNVSIRTNGNSSPAEMQVLDYEFDTGNYQPIRASSHITPSDMRTKNGINELDAKWAHKVIADAPSCKWRYNWDDKDDVHSWHFGPMANKLPEEAVTSPDDRGMLGSDSRDLVGILWAAVADQQKRIVKLEGQVAALIAG